MAIVGVSAARLLLVAHAVLAAVLVAATTHLVVWSMPYARGGTARHRGVRLFAVVALAAYGIEFLLGNVLYPAYVVRVRGGVAAQPDLSLVPRLFEIKEHWIALAFPMLLAAVVFSQRRPGSPAPRWPRAVLIAAIGAAICVWSAALIGLFVTAVRSPGASP